MPPARPREPQTVDFYYGLGSRYSYLAATQIAALEAETGCVVRWRPLRPGALTAMRGRDPFRGPPLSGQYEWPYRRRDAECWAAFYGIPYREPTRQDTASRIPATACAAAARFGKTVDFSHGMFRAIFVDDRPIDLALCTALAEGADIASAEFLEAYHAKDTAAALDRAAEDAHRRGAFGVPTFVVGKRLFWGNDRLPLVRYFLGKTSDRA